MDDKCIMEGLLNSVKSSCNLLAYASMEAATPNVHQTFSTALNSALGMQNSLYSDMASRGWYAPEQAPQQKIDQVKQKYASVQ